MTVVELLELEDVELLELELVQLDRDARAGACPARVRHELARITA